MRLLCREKVVPGWLLVQNRKMHSLISMCVIKQVVLALFMWSVRIPHEHKPDVRTEFLSLDFKAFLLN